MFNKKNYFFIFLLIFATAALFAQSDKEYEETLPFEDDGTVSINTYKGSITVETWDKSEVYFHVKIEPDLDGWNSTSPEEQLENCELDFRHSSDYLTLTSEYRKNYGHGSETRALVHYEIKMPASAKLRIDDYKSDTVIENLNSSLNMETYKGRVKITNYSGDIDLETYKGDVDVTFTSLSGDIQFETYKGDIVLELPANSNFDFDFDLGRKGDFSSDFEMTTRNYNSNDGDFRGSVNGGGNKIKFSTYKGEIDLRKS